MISVRTPYSCGFSSGYVFGVPSDVVYPSDGWSDVLLLFRSSGEGVQVFPVFVPGVHSFPSSSFVLRNFLFYGAADDPPRIFDSCLYCSPRSPGGVGPIVAPDTGFDVPPWLSPNTSWPFMPPLGTFSHPFAFSGFMFCQPPFEVRLSSGHCLFLYISAESPPATLVLRFEYRPCL